MIDHSLPNGKDFFIETFLNDTKNLEDPIFAKTPDDKNKRKIERGNDVLTVSPSPHSGIATIADRKFLTYFLNQGIATAANGGEVSNKMQVNAKDLLKVTDYDDSNETEHDFVKMALKRLVSTNIDATANHSTYSSISLFKLLNGFSITAKSENGHIEELEVDLQEWSLKLIRNKKDPIVH